MAYSADRVAAYAYNFWMQHHMEEWPDVRQVARALRLRHAEIDDCSGDGRYQLTGYNVEGFKLGDFSVEAMTPEVEVAWCFYWLPFSAGCICGQHLKHNA